MTELQPNLQYFVKASVKNGEIVETKQLYFDFHLFSFFRPSAVLTSRHEAMNLMNLKITLK